MSNSEIYLTRDEIEHPYANIAVMIEDKRRKAEQMSQTVFSRITASPEVLAENMVYCEDIRIIGYGNNEWKQYWSSPLADALYPDKEEAIAATVAKLKEVCNECQI